MKYLLLKMKFLKHLMTFEKFHSDEVNTDNILTYNPKNGHHRWDGDDTLLSLYFFRLREKNSTIHDDSLELDSYELEKDLRNSIGYTPEELAEDIIGCSVGALVDNAKVIEHLLTGRETGRVHPNKFQLNIPDSLKEMPLDGLEKLADKVVTKIENNEERLEQNREAKQIREEITNNNRATREANRKAKEEEERKQAELNRDLDKANLKNATSASNLEEVEIEPNTEIEHPKFGRGVVVSSEGTISEVRFEDGTRKLGNRFISKFII